LTRAGQIYWYRFDTAGTYSFQMLSDQGAVYRVYQGSDLSTPVPLYKQEVTDVVFGGTLGAPIHFVGEEFRISKAPFYVRVYHPDRAATANYTLLALRHDCSSPELACAVAPGARVPHTMLSSPPVGQPDEAWFELYTEDTPLAQTIDMGIGELDPGAQGIFELEIFNVDGAGQLASVGADTLTEGDPASSTGGVVLDVEDTATGKAKYFMAITRDPAQAPYPPAGTYFEARWTTNLTYFFGPGENPLKLICLEENDGAIDDGDDEVYLTGFYADGTKLVGTYFIGDFDEGGPADLAWLLPGRVPYVDKIKWRGYEDDSAISGNNDAMRLDIGTLGPFVEGPVAVSRSIWPENGGKYALLFNLTHGFDD
jgi:hypothetical protein